MKSNVIHSGISVVLLFTFVLLSHEVMLAQNQTPGKYQGINQPYQAILKDTIRPTLSVCGKGLPYYEYIFLKQQEKMYLFKYRGEEKSIMEKATFSESDLESLRYNLLFIEKQYQIQTKEWIRKDKWDLNLGEAIKGFYMKPVF